MKNKQIRTIALSTLMVFLAFCTYKSFEKKQKPIVIPVPPVQIQLEVKPVPILEKKYSFEEACNQINGQEIKKDLEYLASDELEGRMSGKKGNVVAAAFIKNRCESYGLKTMYDRFSIRQLNPGPKNETGDNFTQNIYAWIEGTEVKDEIIVIGAHMDHIGYGPSMSRARNRIQIHNGADDNASGTTALLQIAKAFSLVKDKVKRTVVFQFYSAEEMGLIGSRFYCSNPKFPIDQPDIKKHIAMINMDMVGYLKKGVFFTGFNSGESSLDLQRMINSLDSKYSFAKQISSRGSGGSDHASFYNKHVPVVFLHTGLHPYYHTPEDDADKINYVGLEQIAKYAFELACAIDQNNTRPAFHLTSFKEMEYTHDHGHPEAPFHHHH
jgi:hypothetical protein